MSSAIVMSMLFLLAMPVAAGATGAPRPSGEGPAWRDADAARSLARRRAKKKKKKDGKDEGPESEEHGRDAEGKPFVEEPPDVDGTQPMPPEVLYPDEAPPVEKGRENKEIKGDIQGEEPDGHTPAAAEDASGKPAGGAGAGKEQPEVTGSEGQPPAGPAGAGPAGDDAAGKPGPADTKPGTPPARTTDGDAGAQPLTPAAQRSEDMFRVELFGGMRLPRSRRLQFGGGALFAADLGSLVGWKGLYLFAEQDAFSGEDQLGRISYVLLDTLAGLQGRFALGPVRLVAGVGFGVRIMAVTENLSDPRREPETGFGAAGMAGVELPLGSLVSVLVRADARYMKNPLSGQFYWSGVFVAGAGLRF